MNDFVEGIIWTSKNGNWRLHHLFLPESPEMYWYLDNLENGECDYPVMYDNRQVVYDYPEKLPKYVKTACKQVMTKERIKI